MDQDDISKANLLLLQRWQVVNAIKAFDAGGRIISLTVSVNREPPYQGMTVATDQMNYPPQMVEAIKTELRARETEILDELDRLGVAAPEPGPPRPPSVPRIISRRQFFQASAGKGMITQEEALDAVRHGEIPALMQQGLDTLSSDEKFAAEMLLSGAGEFERRHPLVNKFAETMHMPPEVLDDMWRYAATL